MLQPLLPDSSMYSLQPGPIRPLYSVYWYRSQRICGESDVNVTHSGEPAVLSAEQATEFE